MIKEEIIIDTHLDDLDKEESHLKGCIEFNQDSINKSIVNLNSLIIDMKTYSYESGKIQGFKEGVESMRKEKGKTIKADQYVGDKTTIASAKIETMKHGDVIRLTSDEIKFKGDDSLPEEKTLRASRIFGLGKSEDDGKHIVIEDSKLDKFLIEKKVVIKGDYDVGDSVKELVGVDCIIQKNDDGFLELS